MWKELALIVISKGIDLTCVITKSAWHVWKNRRACKPSDCAQELISAAYFNEAPFSGTVKTRSLDGVGTFVFAGKQSFASNEDSSMGLRYLNTLLHLEDCGIFRRASKTRYVLTQEGWEMGETLTRRKPSLFTRLMN